MSEFIQDFIKKNRNQFLKYEDYIKENDWTETKPVLGKQQKKKKGETETDKVKEEEYKYTVLSTELKNRVGESTVQDNLLTMLLDKLKFFSKEAVADVHLKAYKDFIRESIQIINIHIDRAERYNEEVDIALIPFQSLRSDEIAFHNLLFKQTSKLQKGISDLNFNEKEEEFDKAKVNFYNDKKAPLIMREPLSLLREDIKEKTQRIPVDWAVRTSKEMFINMNPRDVPKWNSQKHYFDQDPVVLQFWTEELNKIKHGVNIGGYFIHPWLYFHLNFFRTPIPQKDGSEPNIQPDLRDNEWFFAENLKSCINPDNENYYSKAMLMYGTRRFGKSVILASLAHWRTITKFNSFGSVIGGSSSDINALTSKIKTSMNFIDEPLRMQIIKQEWDNGETTFGIKEDASNPIVFSTLIVQNLESGAKSKTQKTAGLAPSVSIYDEIGKYAFLKPYLAALPSFKTPYGFKCITVLAGCVCAGTKIWDNKGNLINIEDLKPEEGIIGFDVDNQKMSKENITYWQPPHEKECYRIETNTGRTLECSDDHPILQRSKNIIDYRNGRRNGFNKMFFTETKTLKVGDSIGIIQQVDLYGDMKMWNPRLVGLLIGDGSYGKDKTPILSNCDEDVNNYVYENFDAVCERSHITKDGRNYKETRIRKICPELRKLGIYGQTKHRKTLPINIHSYCKEDICELIGGFFDADGTVQSKGKNNMVSIPSMSKHLLKELQLLLQKIGVHGGIKTCKLNVNNKIDKNDYYRLTIADKRSLNEFHKNIKFLISYKQEKLDKIVKELQDKKEKIPKRIKNIRFERVVKLEYIGKKEVYNLTAGNTHTYIANGIITHNTGGESDLSKDAVDVLSNPEAYDLLAMNWDLLENHIDPENITWKRRKFATYFPGQMAYEDGFIKQENKFSDFLKIKDKELDKISIHTTNWEKNTKLLTSKIEEAKKMGGSKGKLLEQQRRVQYPIDPEDCFMSSEDNIFPGIEAQNRKNYLLETGDFGKRVTLSQNPNGKITYELNNKPLADYPFGGGFIDAPGVMYEEIPDEKPVDYLYLAGFDDYKQQESSTDSVGSFHIYKVNIGMDKWCGRIVFSMATRPDPHSKLHRQIFLAMQAYNAKVFMENADNDFKEYLDRKRVTDMWLVESVDFKSDMAQKSNARRRYGWTPTPENIRFLKGLVKKYMEQEHTIVNENGDEEIILGVDLVNDIGLLDEMISYRPDNNVDRITSFMSCLGYEYIAHQNYLIPNINRKKKQTEEKTTPKTQKNLAERMYGNKPNRKLF